MEFQIYGTSESADLNPQRSWEWLGELRTLSKAKNTAKRVSNMKMWHEVEVRGEKEGETTHHSYWRNGRIEIDMML